MIFSDADKTKFWSHVDRTGECWLWQSFKSRDGYGLVNLQKRMWRAHRIAYWLTYDNPGELFVCHRCDNPSCVRPDHLFLGTTEDNMADMVAKGRSKKGAANASHIAGGAYQRGEKNGRAKITEEQALEIRMRGTPYRRGIYAQLAREYGLTDVAIRKIVRAERWAHIGQRGQILEASI